MGKTIVKKGLSVKDIQPFYLTPNSVNGSKSVVKTLISDYGVETGGIKTFNTGTFSSTKESEYNNRLFKLVVDGKKVQLVSKSGTVTKIEGHWTVNAIAKALKSKNSKITGLTETQVLSLIKNGELGVKFNVLKKDHGTKWSRIRKQATVQAKPVQISDEVRKKAFDEFSKDIFYRINQFGQTYSFV
jgi:hypothetical protein